jgi:hypothetical protein
MKTPLRMWGSGLVMSGLTLVLLSAVVALQFLITLQSASQNQRVMERIEALNRFEYEQTRTVLRWEDAYHQDPHNWIVPEGFKRVERAELWVLEGTLRAEGYRLDLRLELRHPRWRIQTWRVLPEVPDDYADGDPVYGG